MKKKIVSILLAAAMTVSALGGCGRQPEKSAETAALSGGQTDKEAETEENAQAQNGLAESGQTQEPSTENAQAQENPAEKHKAQDTAADEIQSVDGMAMGRYVESKVELPEKVVLKTMTCMEDGRLRMAAIDYSENEEGQLTLWDSSDGGAGWERAALLPPEYAEKYPIAMALAPDGGGAATLMVSRGADSGEADSDETDSAGAEAEGYDIVYVSFDDKGNAKPTLVGDMETGDRDKMFSYLSFSENGDLVGLSYGGGAAILDRETGEAKHQLCSEGSVVAGTCGSEALILKETELQRFDLSSGEPLPEDEALSTAMFAEGASYYITTGGAYPLVMASDAEGRLYYCTRQGIFAHMPGGGAVEKIVDGSLNSLSDPSIGISAMTVAGQIFYVSYMGAGGESGIMKFEYDPDVSSVPEQELTIYSLEENQGVRQTITQFQNLHPEVYVNYQCGMSGGEGVTVSDALRTLNTDILAGNGPDILLLDGMSVATYEEKGLLMDLSGILQEVKDSDGLMENITASYQRENGIFAVPAKFAIPSVGGKKELIGQVENLQSLEALAKIPGAIAAPDIMMLPGLLYQVCAAGWRQEDGTINQEGLTEYVSSMKKIYDTWYENAPEEMLETLERFKEDGVDWKTADSNYLSEMSLLGGDCGISFGDVGDMTACSGISSVNRINNDCGMELLKGQQSGVFLPVCVLGILNTAKEPELAAEFVKYMLSKEGQLGNQGNGFPVNKQAFEDTLYQPSFEDGEWSASSSNNETGEMVELVYSWPTKEELDKLAGLAESLNVCADTERVLREAVLDQVYRCIAGELSQDEAVNAIMQTVNLYLAE